MTTGPIRNHVRGRRVQVSGSANAETGSTLIQYAHTVVRGVVAEVLALGGGIVVGVGKEPRATQDGPSLVFDWTALEVAAEWFRTGSDLFPAAAGPTVVIVSSEKAESEIPEERRALWDELLASGRVHIESIQVGSRAATLIRQRQAHFASVLFALGGGAGVEHLAEIFLDRRRSVIPLDLPLGASRNDGTGGAWRLAREARRAPHRFVRLDSLATPVSSRLAALATREGATAPELIIERTVALLRDLERPQAFYVRLLNPKHARFAAVEAFFREVVDPVVEAAGMRRIEIGTDRSEHAFMNVAIFESLHYAELAIVDVTGERPNCFIELGYALGHGMKVLVTAEEGTSLPFDQQAIPCHFWTDTSNNKLRQTEFAEFWENKVSRPPIVR